MSGKASSGSSRYARERRLHRERELPTLRIGLDRMQSGYAGLLVAVCLVMVLVFPPIFFDDYPGASVKRTFAIAALVMVALTWICILRWSPLRPGGRPEQPRYQSAVPFASIAILLIVLLPVPILAEVAGVAEGFFIAFVLMWATDFYRLTRWKRRAS